MNIKTEACCYVYVQGNDKDIEKFYDLVRLSKNDEIILYPESGNRFIDNVCYRPYVKSIVTENPWIISTYDKKSVFVLVDGEWENPTDKTYGTSVNMITCNILEYPNTIPLLPLGGIDSINSYKERVRTQDFN